MECICVLLIEIVLMILMFRAIASNFISIFTSAHNGRKSGVEWERNDLVGGVFWGFWLAFLVLTSEVPGFFLFPFEFHEEFSVSSVLQTSGNMILTLLIFPVIFLSTIQKDYFICPITGFIFLSFFRCFFGWFRFYLWSFLILGVPFICVFFIFPFHWSGFILMVFCVACFANVYPLLLGRLAWIIEDDIRKQGE